MKKVYSNNIEKSLKDCYSVITTITSRNEALKNIAALGIKQFGEYITPGSLNLLDEIQICFIEILDQIIFELGENGDTGPDIRDYIIDDLYSRISLTLEALIDFEKYKTNLKNRPLYSEDLVIIRSRHLSDYIPMLVSDSDDMTNLEKNIVKTLLYFTDMVNIDFFYNLLSSTGSGFIRAAAFLGLKYMPGKSVNWEILKEKSHECKKIAEYAENFNTESLKKNRLPENMDEMTFALLHLEKTATGYKKCEDINWILTAFSIIPMLNFENSWYNEINLSLSNILLKLDIDLMRETLKDEAALIRAMNFIDYLPRNIFNRLTGRLDIMGVEFIYNLNLLIEKNKKSIDSYNSNILTYISWNPIESL
ncbi:MAG TPA: hypothetical protein PK358_08735 [Spirochaetota bacterium]|nr:hypothetical protein [Spirochaetota bacterium]HPJ34904.1 hypothetical protein [Spirochaetota bacterium]